MMINGVDICQPDCAGRDPYCHSNCERYLTFHKQRVDAAKERQKDSDIGMFTAESIRRIKSGNYISIRKYRPKGGYEDGR